VSLGGAAAPHLPPLSILDSLKCGQPQEAKPCHQAMASVSTLRLSSRAKFGKGADSGDGIPAEEVFARLRSKYEGTEQEQGSSTLRPVP